MKEFRCNTVVTLPNGTTKKCNRLLGYVDGRVSIKCHSCKKVKHYPEAK